LTTLNVMFYIAVAHSSFNVFNTIVFLPLIGMLEKTSIYLVKEKGESVDFGTQYLEVHLLETPSLALEQVHNENIYLLKVARKAVTKAMECFTEKNVKAADKAIELESVTDNLQSEITHYLVKLSQRNLTENQSKELPVLIHNVNDLERIGDHAQSIAELSRRGIEEKLVFSPEALKEIDQVWNELNAMMDETEEAMKTGNIDLAKKVLLREDSIDKFQETLKQNHIDRQNAGNCNVDAGFVFLELIDNLEKVADRLSNLAESVIGKMQWELKKKEIKN